MLLKAFALLTCSLCLKSLIWFLFRSLKGVSDIPKYFLSGLFVADTTGLYTVLGILTYMCDYDHSRWWVIDSGIIRKDLRANISAATLP